MSAAAASLPFASLSLVISESPWWSWPAREWRSFLEGLERPGCGQADIKTDTQSMAQHLPASQPAISLPPLQLLPLVLAALWEEPSRTGEDVEHLLPQASEGSGNGDWGTESRGPLYP